MTPIPTLFSLTFLIASTERAVKTACQSALLFVGAERLNVLDFAWLDFGGFALGGALLSYLFSYGTGVVTDKPGPSAAGEQLDPSVG